MRVRPIRRIHRGRAELAMIVALLIVVSACSSSTSGSSGFDFDADRGGAGVIAAAPVEQIPETSPTVQEIAAATTAPVSFTYQASLDTIVTAEKFALKGVFLPASSEGFNEWELAPSIGRSPTTHMWIDASNLFRSDGRLDRGLRPTKGHVYEFLGLGVEPPTDRGLSAALTALLAADAEYTVIGTDLVEGTELLHLQGARFGKIGPQKAAPLTIDVWIDANNRLARVVTAATFDNAAIPQTVRSISFQYLSESPELPVRPTLVGADSPEPAAAGVTAPLVDEIVSATGSMDYFEIGSLLQVGGIELRQRSVYNATSGRGYHEAEFKQPGEDFEWLESGWYENGESWITNDGQRDQTRSSSADISDMFGLRDASGVTLDEVLKSALETDTGLVLVGEEDLDGARVLHLIGGSDEKRDETIVEVWVDRQHRLVRYVATSWQFDIDSASGISTTDLAYPDQVPDIPIRPDEGG